MEQYEYKDMTLEVFRRLRSSLLSSGITRTWEIKYSKATCVTRPRIWKASWNGRKMRVSPSLSERHPCQHLL